MLPHMVIWRSGFDRAPATAPTRKPRPTENWFDVARTLADAAATHELALEIKKLRLLLTPMA